MSATIVFLIFNFEVLFSFSSRLFSFSIGLENDDVVLCFHKAQSSNDVPRLRLSIIPYMGIVMHDFCNERF